MRNVETALVPITVIKESHVQMKHSFVSKVIELLQVENFEIKAYSVSEEYYKTEAITIVVEGVTLEIRTKI